MRSDMLRRPKLVFLPNDLKILNWNCLVKFLILHDTYSYLLKVHSAIDYKLDGWGTASCEDVRRKNPCCLELSACFYPGAFCTISSIRAWSNRCPLRIIVSASVWPCFRNLKFQDLWTKYSEVSDIIRNVWTSNTHSLLALQASFAIFVP